MFFVPPVGALVMQTSRWLGEGWAGITQLPVLQSLGWVALLCLLQFFPLAFHPVKKGHRFIYFN